MATHTTCDGCGKPVDTISKNQDQQPGRVTVYRGHVLCVAEINDLCDVCLADALAFVNGMVLKGKGAGARG